MTETRLDSNLKRRAASWAGQLTKMAKALAPAHVQSAISSKVELKDNGEYIIRITADRRKAPDARAQELGSGKHAKHGPKGTYPIYPKEKQALAFNWEVLKNPEAVKAMYGGQKFIGFTDDGRGIFRWVDHPGIEAANEGQGYLAPAMKELKARAREQLTEDIRQAVAGDLRESFGKKPK